MVANGQVGESIPRRDRTENSPKGKLWSSLAGFVFEGVKRIEALKKVPTHTFKPPCSFAIVALSG